MMTHPSRTLAAIALALTLGGSPAAAQSASTPESAGGWVVTPAFAVNSGWDTNALFRGDHAETPGDFVNVLNPSVDAVYRGRRGHFSGGYSSTFSLYRSLDDLNSFDQHTTVSGRRLLTKHITLFGSNQLTMAPTTDVTELAGLPYMRVGTTSETVRGGIDAALSKRTSLVSSYSFQVVRFDEDQFSGSQLRGGHSHSGAVNLRRILNRRTTLTADYDIQRATFGELDVQQFDIQRTEGGVEHRPTATVTIFGSFGVARVTTNVLELARTGPSWRAGIARTIRGGSLAVTYGRTFVPAYGFGGTQENEELVGRVQLTPSRYLYTRGDVAWRLNQPLVQDEKLRTFSLHASLGYMLAPWAGIEGFFSSTHQNIDRAGGNIERQRFGVQFVTNKPMRIR
jgi:hypothetical protein